MPLSAVLPPLLLALLPPAAACAALPLRRLPAVLTRLLAAAAAGMQLGAALFLLLLPALSAAEHLHALPIWLPTCGGVLLGAIPHLPRRPAVGAGPAEAAAPLPQLLLPALALGALTASFRADVAALPPSGLLSAAAVITAQYLTENLSPRAAKLYTCFMHTSAAYLPAAAAVLSGYALAVLLPPLRVLLPSLGAGALLYRNMAQTIPQLQQSYRDNLCTLCILLGFTLILFLYCLSR